MHLGRSPRRKRRCRTRVCRSPRQMSKAEYPQVWKMGALNSVRLPARSGMRSMMQTRAAGPRGSGRAAPRGVPVVPDVSMTVRPRGRGGCRGSPSRAARAWAASSDSLTWATVGARSATAEARSSSWTTRRRPSRSATCATAGPDSPTLSSTRSRPSMAAPAMTATASTWFRASRPTASPGPGPIARNAPATLTDRASSSAYEISPWASSMTAILPGLRAAAPRSCPSSPYPQVRSARTWAMLRCGKPGLNMPRRAIVLRMTRRLMGMSAGSLTRLIIWGARAPEQLGPVSGICHGAQPSRANCDDRTGGTRGE